MEKNFFQYRIFPLSFFFFRSCDAPDITKITSACNIWETKQTQEKYGRGGRSIKTGNVKGEPKMSKQRQAGRAARRRPGERLGVHRPTRVPWESAENCRVTSALLHKRTTAFHLCFIQKTWPPSKPNNSSATNLPAQGHNHAYPSLPPHRG